MNKVVDGLLLCLGAYFFWNSNAFDINNVTGDVGPAFFPKLMAVCLLILVVSDLYLNIRKDRKMRKVEKPQNKDINLPSFLPKAKKVYASLGIPNVTLIMIALTIVYLLLLPLMGFAISTVIYTIAMMLIYGVHSKKVLFWGGFFSIIVIYLIFSKLLLVPLP
ncbi:tripartite tricarboxylate transporter TctB family protein [Candidatus Formimonas warabiya]|uniref:DUF1468 domain-containing protein n=1 Tax=Formimonas warabiya TaxID=1761012 RepID=A0A3G1KM41_FORW1|nr:tripartite tricarboxylate transporter TctB family protein [Candidatus Formimonas warabiya]ATW23479.1 hypothetical protein DCMF_00510 [Candidatus Formimonas warabiya]